MYQFWGHCDLDLLSRIIMSGAFFVYYLKEQCQIWCMDASLGDDMSCTILRSLTLT